jgi:hypothetical protein
VNDMPVTKRSVKLFKAGELFVLAYIHMHAGKCSTKTFCCSGRRASWTGFVHRYYCIILTPKFIVQLVDDFAATFYMDRSDLNIVCNLYQSNVQSFTRSIASDFERTCMRFFVGDPLIRRREHICARFRSP